jgi:hypothetical protein
MSERVIMRAFEFTIIQKSAINPILRVATRLFSREFPPIAACLTLTKRCHRFIGTPRLGLTVRNLSLVAPWTRQRVRDTLLGLRDGGILDVLGLHLGVFGFALFGDQFLRRHDDELFRRDVTAQDSATETGIGGDGQVGEEGADLGPVLGLD